MNFKIKKNLIFDKRIEFFQNKSINFLANSQIVKNFFFFSDINFCLYSKKIKLFNIYFLDLLFTYRGYRHLKCLPLRGQRTWTNGNNSNSCNLILKNYKILIIKKFINTSNLFIVNNFIFLEYINLIWKLNWTSEWYSLKKKKLFYQKKKTKNLKFKIDELSINTELASLRSILLKKKSKVLNKNSLVALGFEPGQSLLYIK